MFERCGCCHQKLPTTGMKGRDCYACYIINDPNSYKAYVRCLCVKCSDQGFFCARCQRYILKNSHIKYEN